MNTSPATDIIADSDLPSPPTPATTATATIIRAKPAIKTYGKAITTNLNLETTTIPTKLPLVKPSYPSSSTLSPTYSSSVIGDLPEEEEESIPILTSESMVIPETDFDLPRTIEKVSSSLVVPTTTITKKIDRRSRQDRIDEGEEVEEILDEGLLSSVLLVNNNKKDVIASSSSSPLKAGSKRRDLTSTDPTSEEEDQLHEEEEDATIKKKSNAFNISTSSPCPVTIVGASIDSDASSDDDEDVDMLDQTVIRVKTVQEEMDELNAQYAEEDRLEEERLKSLRTAGTSTSSIVAGTSVLVATAITPPSFPLPVHLAGNSSLTSLATTILPSPPSTFPVQSKSTSVRPQSITTTSEAPASSEAGNISNSSSPPAQNIKRRRIVDSDEDEGEEAVVVSKKLSTSTARRVQDSSDMEDEENETTKAPLPSTSTLPILTKKERLEAMALKRAPPPTPVIAEEIKKIERSRSMSYSEGDSDDGRGGKGKKGKGSEKKKKRKGELSKKDESALNSETAALLRNQPIQSLKTTKNFMTPSDIAAKRIRAPVTSLRAQFLPTPDHSRPVPVIEVSSGTSTIAPSSDIEPADTPARATISSRRPANSILSTPLPLDRRTLNKGKAVHKVMSEEEEEEDLPTMEEIDRKAAEDRIKAQKKRELDARKAKAIAAIAASKAKAPSSIDEDSDSDIEILPPPKKLPSSTQTLPATLEQALSTPRLSTNERTLRGLAGAKAIHIEEDVTESQLDAAAHTFGKRLGEVERSVPRNLKRDSMGGLLQSIVRLEKKTKTVQPTADQLHNSLLHKVREQNAAEVLKKETMYRQTLNKQREEAVATEYNAREFMDNLGARKKDLEREKLMKDEEEDAEDGDYQGEEEDDEMGDEVGSGSDGGDAMMGIDDEAMESGSEAEVEAIEKEATDDEEEDDDDELAPLPTLKRRKIQIDDEDEMDDQDSSDELSLPKKVILPAAMGGGFSQFFDDDFSQEVRQGAETDGYKSVGNIKAKMADTGNELLNIEERDEDIALLESRNAFKYDTLATPQVVPAPQQYINKNGLLTQNRPANLYEYEDSSPYHIPTILDSASQGLTPSQVDNGRTPSRAPIGQALRAASSFVFALSSVNASASLTAPEPTELVATEIAEEPETQDEETQDIFAALPSAQPPRDAFSVLLAQKTAPVINTTKKRAKNAFVDDQVELSDEEDTRMGAISDDEDETGMDAEDAEIVDNAVIDAELAQEQDALADELRRNLEEQDEATNLKHAQGVADGKARANAKGLGDFDDQDFDDDNWGMSKHKAKPRADNSTLAAIAANQETASFAAAMNLEISLPDEELDHLLHAPEGLALEKKVNKFQSRQRVRQSIRAGESDDGYLSENQVESEIEDASDEEEVHGSDDDEGYGRSLGQLEYDSRHIEIAPIHSSSPVKSHNIKRPKVKSGKAPVRPGELLDESQYQKLYDVKAIYKGASKDESQDNSNGVTAGAKSSVTSFIGQKARATATYGGKVEAGQHGKLNILAKESSFGFRKKNNFAT